MGIICTIVLYVKPQTSKLICAREAVRFPVDGVQTRNRSVYAALDFTAVRSIEEMVYSIMVVIHWYLQARDKLDTSKYSSR
jgi:hypothetical protein